MLADAHPFSVRASRRLFIVSRTKGLNIGSDCILFPLNGKGRLKLRNPGVWPPQPPQNGRKVVLFIVSRTSKFSGWLGGILCRKKENIT
jgi:hypothetical protein